MKQFVLPPAVVFQTAPPLLNIPRAPTMEELQLDEVASLNTSVLKHSMWLQDSTRTLKHLPLRGDCEADKIAQRLISTIERQSEMLDRFIVEQWEIVAFSQCLSSSIFFNGTVIYCEIDISSNSCRQHQVFIISTLSPPRPLRLASLCRCFNSCPGCHGGQLISSNQLYKPFVPLRLVSQIARPLRRALGYQIYSVPMISKCPTPIMPAALNAMHFTHLHILLFLHKSSDVPLYIHVYALFKSFQALLPVTLNCLNGLSSDLERPSTDQNPYAGVSDICESFGFQSEYFDTKV